MSPSTNNPATRRPMDAEDYLDALRRRRTWLFGPLLGGLVLAVSGSFLWPETYQSNAVLRVTNPIIAQPILQSPLATTISDRIGQMATSVTSRTILQTVISTYDLYPRELKRLPVEDVVELMRRNIQISPVQTMSVGERKGVQAFSIRFAYRNRFLAQKVTADLAGRFTSANVSERNLGQTLVLSFARNQFDAARAKLESSDAKLAAFRTQFRGKLPDQTDAATQQLNNLQLRSTMVQNSSARASQELLLLKTNLAIDEEKSAALHNAPRQKSEKLQALERQLAALASLVASLKDQYTDKHPDLRAARQRLDRLTEEHAKASLLEPTTIASSDDGNLRRTRAQIDSKLTEIADLQKQSRQLNDDIHTLDSRLISAPVVEREYTELTRGRDSAKAEFLDTETRFRKLEDSSKGETARLFESLERLDPASLPTEPTEPKRMFIIGFGLMFGLFIGLSLVGAQEWRDPSLKNFKDVRTYSNLTVLFTIPEIEDDLVVRRRNRPQFLGWTASLTLGILLMASAIGYYYATRV